MGKRYRSLRRSFKMNVAPGKVILWDGYRFPPRNKPACKDKEVIDFIEGRKGFGKLFWPEQDPDSIIVDPAKVPVDCELAHLQRAADSLNRMGYNVNPALLKDQDEEAPQLPSKTAVSSMKRDELEALVKKLGWGEELDLTLGVKDLKKAIREKIDTSQ